MKFLWKLFSRLLASLLSVLLFLSLILLPVISFTTEISDSSTLIDLIFSSSILDQLSVTSAKHHSALLSNGTVDTGSNQEVDKLVESLKDKFINGELRIKDLINDLRGRIIRGEIDITILTAVLQELIDSGALNAEELMKELGIPEALYQALLSPNGTLDLSTLVDTFHILMNSGLLDMETLLEEIGIPADAQIDTEQITKSLAKSSVAKELIATYTEDILNAATGVNASQKLTSGTVLDIITSHMDEIVTLVEDNLPEDVEIDRSKLESAIDKAASVALPALVDSLPPAKELADKIIDQENPTLATAMDILRFIRSGHLRISAIVIVAVLALLIFLLRLPGFSGLHWVGSEALSGALIIGALAFFLQTQQIVDLLYSFANETTAFITPLLSEVSAAFVPFAIIYGVAGLALIVSSKILDATFDRD